MLLNLFAKVLPTMQVNGYENAAEMTIAMRKYRRFSGGKIEIHSGIGIILEMAKATPLLALIIIKSAAETKIMHAVFTADNVIIVCLVLVSPLAVIAIIVPVADVAPGTIATNAPDMVPVITEIIDFVEFLICGSLIRWSFVGKVEDCKELIIVDRPNMPTSAGKRIEDVKPTGERTERLNMM